MATNRTTVDQIRLAAENDLITFIKLVAPKQVLGHIHEEVCTWWTRQDAKSHQILLLPRDHQKSRLVAYRVAWEITRQPWIRVLYISSTSGLAEAQLKFIKDILTSDFYRRYWPEMVNIEEGKREKWTNEAISVDHPKRKEEQVRDPTIFIGGLTTSLTGRHCDIAVLDDIVVLENAYTEDGRAKVETQYSLLSSIEGADCQEWVVGTRYDLRDLYGKMISMQAEIYDKKGEQIGSEPVYEVFQKEVETVGDGTGEFLWPRTQRSDGRWFGFDANILAKKRAQYLDASQFYAQYYNNPNDPGSARVASSCFQYYDPRFLDFSGNSWWFKENKLNVFGAIDFAYSLSKRSDYTCLVICGIDALKNIYILDIDRFKTDRISDYYEHILKLMNKWDFRKLRCETTAAQQAIVRELKESYIRPNGLVLAIDEHKPNSTSGAKQERIDAILKPLYENQMVWHYRNGNCQLLEEELIANHPPHDDISDALSNCVDICVAPSSSRLMSSHSSNRTNLFSSRFGGVAF